MPASCLVLIEASFSYGNNGEILSAFTPFQNRLANFINIVRNFRNQNNICTAGNACIQREPTGFVSHDFAEQNPGVAVCSCVQPIQCICGNVNSCMETECDICSINIIVDRLWQAYDIQAFVCQQF